MIESKAPGIYGYIVCSSQDSVCVYVRCTRAHARVHTFRAGVRSHFMLNILVVYPVRESGHNVHRKTLI